MKKITTLPFLLTILICIYACADYKPIFGSANLQFEIADYSVEGDKKLGNKIYSKLYNLSKSNKNQKEITSVVINIKVLKEKNSTSKDATGKILEYKINLNTKVIVKNYLTNDTLLDKNFISSLSYKVQDQYSETIKLENKVIEDLINRTYQDLLIKLSENILTK
tara:strand:+ start:34 stop:528 length:495 start_codon:yes stop_codon:yes gene_type:complete